MKWQILIPSIHKRREALATLKQDLYNQIIDADMIGEIDLLVISDWGGYISIGDKRNYLLNSAKAKYVSFFDDDDQPSRHYIKKNLEGIEKDVDCNSLRGIYTVDGNGGEIFEHSIQYKEYKTNPPTMGIRYERYPNHLNVIKREIATQFKFPTTNHGEDTDWATQVFNSGLIKTEHEIIDVIYHYQFKSDK